MIDTSASSGAPMIEMLAMMLPILGVSLFLLSLPSTRRLMTRRFSAIRRFFADPEPAPTPEQPDNEDQDDEDAKRSATAAQFRPRSEDPEIQNFDRAIFDRFTQNTPPS